MRSDRQHHFFTLFLVFESTLLFYWLAGHKHRGRLQLDSKVGRLGKLSCTGSLRLSPSRRLRVRFISSKIPKNISESSRGGSDPTAYGWSTLPADNLLIKNINCRVMLASKLIAWRARAIESGQMAPILCEDAPRCSMQPRQVSCTCPSALPKAVDAPLAVEEAALGHREV